MTEPSRQITATVNGAQITRQVPNRMTLAEFLRCELRLSGTKLSCELQVCGVCSVLVDGAPVSSCAYLAVDTDGREVLTVEGLAGEGSLHPLQEAFVEHFALQCGFCTPGFLVMAKALLDENPYPSDDEIKHYLDGNICRCTGYRPIIQAVRSVAGKSQA